MEQKNSRQIKFKRLKNQVKAVVTNPYNVIVLVAIVLLTYLIVLPLVDMLSTTFQLAQRDLRATGGTMADVGKFTLYYWQRLFAAVLSGAVLAREHPWFPLGEAGCGAKRSRLMMNSLTIGVGVSVCAIALGSILAWLMVRSDLPFKPFFSLAVIIPYMIPSWVKSQAWLSMFKTPRVGGAPGFIAALMMNAGMSTDRIEAILSPIAYGRLAIIIVLTLHYYAYTYLLVSAALNSINSELEEMGEIQGASKPLILRKITLPLVLPAMLSAVILTFSKAIGTFGTINYLGSPVSFRTLSSELYSNSKSQNTQTAFAMAILMICAVPRPETDLVCEGMPEAYHPTTWHADRAIEFIQVNGAFDAPWFLSVNFYDPHHPFDPPAEYLERALKRSMKAPLPGPGPRAPAPSPFLENEWKNGAYNRLKEYRWENLSPQAHRCLRAAYWAMIDLLDHQIGRILDALEKSGQMKNTIVVFMSDHGEMLGDHGVYLKGPHFYECSVRVPAARRVA